MKNINEEMISDKEIVELIDKQKNYEIKLSFDEILNKYYLEQQTIDKTLVKKARFNVWKFILPSFACCFLAFGISFGVLYSMDQSGTSSGNNIVNVIVVPADTVPGRVDKRDIDTGTDSQSGHILRRPVGTDAREVSAVQSGGHQYGQGLEAHDACHSERRKKVAQDEDPQNLRTCRRGAFHPARPPDSISCCRQAGNRRSDRMADSDNTVQDKYKTGTSGRLASMAERRKYAEIPACIHQGRTDGFSHRRSLFRG